MDSWTPWLIILLVLGFIIGNITLLKYSAKFKFPTELSQRKKENRQDEDEG